MEIPAPNKNKKVYNIPSLKLLAALKLAKQPVIDKSKLPAELQSYFKFVVRYRKYFKSKKHERILFKSAKKGHTEILPDLIALGVNLNKRGSSGSVLNHAAWYHQIAWIEYFLQLGVYDVNTYDRRGSTALIFAAGQSLIDAVKVFLDHGAEINLHDQDIWTNPLIEAADQGRNECVEFLIQNGADLNFQNKKGDTALMKAAHSICYDCKQCVKLLLKYNADPHIRNINQQNALELAIWNNYKESIALLRDRMNSQNS